MNKLLPKIKSIKSKTVLPLLLAAAVGIILMSLPKSEKKEETPAFTERDYCLLLETKTKEIIENVSGVKDCEVFITLENGFSYVFGSDYSTKQTGDSVESEKKIIFSDTALGKEPAVAETLMPKVASVAVVCKKAPPETQYRVIALLKALFDVPANRISVQT